MDFLTKLLERLQELLVVPGHQHSIQDCLTKLLEAWRNKQFDLQYLGCVMFLAKTIREALDKPTANGTAPVLFGGADQTALLAQVNAAYAEVSGESQPPFGLSADAATAAPFGAGGALIMALLPLLLKLLEAWLNKG